MSFPSSLLPIRPWPRGCRLAALLLALCLLPALLGACRDEEQPARVDFDKRQQALPPATPHGVTYAYLPQYSHTISHARHHLLARWLRESTGLPVRQVFPDTFEEHIEMVRRGEIDISYVNPFAYLKMAAHGARTFARVVEPSGAPEFRGEVIVRADNAAIQTLEDCRGKRLIAVDPASAGGWLFPMGLFLEHGLTRRDFADITFAPGPGGKQEKVVLAVHAGLHDVGVVRDGTLEMMANRVDIAQLRVLGRSRTYPGWLFAARQGLDPQVVGALARAMFRLSLDDPALAAILTAANIQRIIPASDEDYQPVRELLRRLEAEDMGLDGSLAPGSPIDIDAGGGA